MSVIKTKSFMLCYYSHPISIYNTPQEQRDIELLFSLGFHDILNPNTKELRDKYTVVGMDVYLAEVAKCGVLAFRSFPDGSIGAGVAKEIEHAQSLHMPVIELPTITSKRILSVDDTREYLKLSGSR